MGYSLFCNFTRRKIRSLLPTFRYNLSDPSPKAKQSKKNAIALRYAVYIENGVDGD
jgi:hypothetical protein